MVHPFQFFWFVVYPYICLGSFFIGTAVRFIFYNYTINARSSEIFEKKYLMIGSILFHLGLLGVFGGHVVGLLIPESWTSALGISNELYHHAALLLGGIFGSMFTIGAYILCIRRLFNKRVRKTSSAGDIFIIIALTIVITMGMLSSFVAGPSNPSFNYRLTIAPWLRQLFIFQPNWHLMLGIPLFYKIHVIVGMFIFAVFPYTRLVHALVLPLQYFTRRYVVYRRKPRID